NSLYIPEMNDEAMHDLADGIPSEVGVRSSMIRFAKYVSMICRASRVYCDDEPGLSVVTLRKPCLTNRQSAFSRDFWFWLGCCWGRKQLSTMSPRSWHIDA